MRRLSANTYWLVKSGNAPGEYEDAFWAGKGDPAHPERVSYAIADGATESLLSANWASLLVKRFTRHWREPAGLDAWLANTLRAWQHDKQQYIRMRERNHKPIQWYEEPGLEAGAFAALLGLVLREACDADPSGAGQGLHWHAAAIGDCCLAQVRAQDLICAFPLDRADAFTNRPFLLSSHPARNNGIAERFQFAEGEAVAGDRFYLMTDALAVWFLRTYEEGGAPWQELDALRRAGKGSRAFAEWIDVQRAAHTLTNDDVTLIRLEVR